VSKNFKPISKKGGKCVGEWVHTRSGWRVKHCGHPTAIWPYHLIDPARPQYIVMTHNGLGWRRKEDACADILRIYAGLRVVTDINCYPLILRVVTPTQYKELKEN
jgi:hypothetical protein